MRGFEGAAALVEGAIVGSFSLRFTHVGVEVAKLARTPVHTQ
jgi:hypothetical protein